MIHIILSVMEASEASFFSDEGEARVGILLGDPRSRIVDEPDLVAAAVLQQSSVLGRAPLENPRVRLEVENDPKFDLLATRPAVQRAYMDWSTKAGGLLFRLHDWHRLAREVAWRLIADASTGAGMRHESATLLLQQWLSTTRIVGCDLLAQVLMTKQPSRTGLELSLVLRRLRSESVPGIRGAPWGSVLQRARYKKAIASLLNDWPPGRDPVDELIAASLSMTALKQQVKLALSAQAQA